MMLSSRDCSGLNDVTSTLSLPHYTLNLHTEQGTMEPLQLFNKSSSPYASMQCRCMQLSLGAWLHVDQSTVSKTVWRVTQAILTAYPNPFSMDPSTSTDFLNNFNVPLNCLGLIDCTHVRILKPHKTHFPIAYINRKKFFSINVQIVCDSWGSVINLVVQWPGSVHDSRIFNNCTLYNDLSSGNLDGYLIVESGYALAPFCQTP